MDATLPNELGALRELVSTLQGTLHAAQAENKLLRQKLELFLKRYFGGTKNESLDPKQLELLLAGLAAKPTPARATIAARPVRHARMAKPAHPGATPPGLGNRAAKGAAQESARPGH